MGTSGSQIAVLLCTYNGERHLPEQLHSIVAPAGLTLHLYASDDGSSDNTLQQLHAYASGAGFQVSVKSGPGHGHAANFLSLLCSTDIQGDFFAYADQDDIWGADKLARAHAALAAEDPDCPVLYCTRTRTVSEAGQLLGLSPLFTRQPSFANALVQNIAGGNTMVMNAAARNILCQAGPVDVVSHDWWTYLLITGAGGKVIYDHQPSLSYRQHSANSIGANTGWHNRAQRYLGFLSGRNRNWNARNIAALQKNVTLLTDIHRQQLELFCKLRQAGLAQRLRALREGGFYAQTATGNFGLIAATLLKKI